MNIFSNNKNTIQLFLFLIFLFWKGGMVLLAQTTLTGKVIDGKNGEELMGAEILITKNGDRVRKQKTDKNGNYRINVDPGEYEIEIVFSGYPSCKVEDIVAIQDQDVLMNIELDVHGGWESVYISYREPIIRRDMTTIGKILEKVKIRDQPNKCFLTKDLQEIIIQTPGVSWQ